jgi:hypothetical protein
MMRFNAMKPIVVIAGIFVLATMRPELAGAWSSANRYGGSTTHTEGETSHTNTYGGSSSHSYGEGTEHSNAYGGSSEHAWGGGSEHTNAYGGSTSGAYGAGATHTTTSGATAYHPPGSVAYPGYPAYHPPVAVPYYSASGCNGCAAAAGAVVGATAGVAVGAAAASAARPPPAAQVAYATLPPGCAYRPVAHEYDCGGTWFAPAYGANGLFYRAVPAP